MRRHRIPDFPRPRRATDQVAALSSISSPTSPLTAPRGGRPRKPIAQGAGTSFLVLTGLFTLLFASSLPLPAAESNEFRPIFDGRSLQGWGTPDPSYWTIEDGAITGRITREHPCGTNQYLVWLGGDLADFELKVKSRLSGDGGINNGFQFRSRVLPDGDVAGYQMDNNLQTDWLVRLYDEFGRHTLAWRGKQTIFDTEGKPTTTDLPDAGGPAWFQLGEWHEYDLLCDGPKLVLRVDGRLAAQVEDHDRRRADPQGALALQLHSGPPTRVQFKDIQLRVIHPAAPATASARPGRSESRRQTLLDSAEAWWDFGVGGHMKRHPLRYVGSLEDFEFNVRADGPNARANARVTLLRGGWFDAGTDLAPTNRAFTLWVRARDPQGRWDGTLLAQGRPEALDGFRLRAETGVLRWERRTANGTSRIDHPLTKLDPTAWHDFVIRANEAEGHVELIVDGTVQATLVVSRTGGDRESSTRPASAANPPWLIGAQPDAPKPTHLFHGELEGAALWNRALKDREIRALTVRRPE